MLLVFKTDIKKELLTPPLPTPTTQTKMPIRLKVHLQYTSYKTFKGLKKIQALSINTTP